MKIKVLGTGCSGCNALYETVNKAVAEMGVDAEVIKEEDMMNIMSYNVLRLPCLVIDEKVVSAGRKLSLRDVKQLINQ